MQPIKFKPIFIEKIWGGYNLKDKFGFNIPKETQIGEVWTISDNRTAVSEIEDSIFEVNNLNDLIKKFPVKILGKENSYKRFPLLIKFIDAQDKLSVQVHPDDKYAYEFENKDLGKTEMWYIIDAEPGSKLICGLKDGTTKEKFIELMETNRLEECLKEVNVQKGDVIFIPSGMVHAIGSGILICEIQQNSDLTYRVYDYNRIDKNGKKRELNIDKALDVIDFNLRTEKIIPKFKEIDGGLIATPVKSRYFNTDIIKVYSKVNFNTYGNFNTLTAVEGNSIITNGDNRTKIQAGETILIPACIENYSIEGKSTILRSYI